MIPANSLSHPLSLCFFGFLYLQKRELQEQVDTLRQINEANEELMEGNKEFEQQLQQEMEEKDNENNTLRRQVQEIQARLDDQTRTIEQFRDRVTTLESELEVCALFGCSLTPSSSFTLSGYHSFIFTLYIHLVSTAIVSFLSSLSFASFRFASSSSLADLFSPCLLFPPQSTRSRGDVAETQSKEQAQKAREALSRNASLLTKVQEAKQRLIKHRLAKLDADQAQQQLRFLMVRYRDR